jgi:hypothetical protein
MPPDIIIEFKNGIQPLKELYYGKGQGKLFNKSRTRMGLISLLLAGLSIYLYEISFSGNLNWVFLMVVSFICFLWTLILLIINTARYLAWKRGVENLIQYHAKISRHALQLTRQAFEFIEDDTSTLEKWDFIKNAKIYPSHVFLTSETNQNFLFPAASMEPAEFEVLKEFVRMAVNGTTILE